MVTRAPALEMNQMWMEAPRDQQSCIETVPRSPRLHHPGLPLATVHAEEGRLRVLNQTAYRSWKQERGRVASRGEPSFVDKLLAPPHEPKSQARRKLVHCILELLRG